MSALNGSHFGGFRIFLQMSNFGSLPGKAGGLPMINYFVLISKVTELIVIFMLVRKALIIKLKFCKLAQEKTKKLNTYIDNLPSY